MCGIVGVVGRPSRREPPDGAALVAALDRALDQLGAASPGEAPAYAAAAELIAGVDHELRGVPGVRCLLGDPGVAAKIEERAVRVSELIAREAERTAERADERAPSAELDPAAALLAAEDALWAIRYDRLRTARAVGDLAGAGAGRAAIEAFTRVQAALSALDRLEVRGRDSAGLHLVVRDHRLDLAAPDVSALLAARQGDPLFRSGSVRAPDGLLCFVYKAAAEIGELGDNTAAFAAAIRGDELLHRALVADTAEVVVLGHTRWASVGVISEANAHPLDATEHRHDGDASDAPENPYAVAVLNGDVDNHVELRDHERLATAAEITTDAKVIPVLVARRLATGSSPDEAFRATVAALEGSVAVAASIGADPGALRLALRGSGQALYVGLAEDAFVIASEPYGLVEETSTYLRMDGETPADSERPGATRGQVVTLDGVRAGEVAGIRRTAYDGTELPVTPDDLSTAEITTRDIDRGDFPHYLLKEITEAPESFRHTLRGRILDGVVHDDAGAVQRGLTVTLAPEAIPLHLAARLVDGTIGRVFVIGQGTAAVAGQSLAAALRAATRDRLVVEALPATELSGFRLVADMHDALVIAISQSGTTTDTNRTVDLVRARGAAVLAIVNRRNSDLVDKSDGVMFTSDGRDVEMSVASTKAFYAQIAAGYLVSIAIGDLLGVTDPKWRDEVLTALRELPDAMRTVLARRPVIAAAARRHCTKRRSWAIVGNGANVIAAAELRIKLSELCYKAIACDVTEDKKHIDLSSEPLVIVCAAGLEGSNAEDVGKELAIYRAHRAAPVVIASEDRYRFEAAADVILVPTVHPELDFVLCTVAGHLFAYEAALAIDASARPLREARAALQSVGAVTEPDDMLARMTGALEVPAQRFREGVRAGEYDGSLDASTAVAVSSLLHYASGDVSLDGYEVEHGRIGTPGAVADDLTAALTRAIEALTRPIDAIKHQAKTVTVGISRADEGLLESRLVREVLGAGASRDRLGYRTLRTLVDLDPAVRKVTGYTRYRIEGDVEADATIQVVDQGGATARIPSRTDRDSVLRGTKRRVASQREVTAGRGRSDGRTWVIVPEVKNNHAVGLTLLHVDFARRLAPDVMRAVLRGYQGRYDALRDAVTETEPTFDDAVLGTVDVVDLLSQPVYVLADHWRRS